MTKQAMPDRTGITGPFLGSHAIGERLINARGLRSARFTRLFHNVYVPAHLPVTHGLRCRAAALIAPGTATLTGASAAAVHGYELAAPFDPVEVVVAEQDRSSAKRGIHIRRSTNGPAEGTPWHGIPLATPVRATLRETLLRRSLPRVVAWLDVLLHGGFIDITTLSVFLQNRHDHGIVRARKALELADPRSASILESETRVWLRLGGLVPETGIEVLGFRLDLSFPARKLAVECRGEKREDPGRDGRETWRRPRLRADGWEFVVVTDEQLRTNPEGVAETAREALHRRTTPLAA